MAGHVLLVAVAAVLYCVVVLPVAFFAIAFGGALCMTVIDIPFGLPLIAVGLRLLWL